jgi:ATP-binding cassette subfamily B protein/subfamily B ATP-binding cassette protein MsbA
MTRPTITGDYQHVFRYFLGEWRSLAGLIVLCVFASVLAALQPWPLKLLVDTVSGTAKASAWFQPVGRDPEQSKIIVIVAAALGTLILYGLSSVVDAVSSYGWMKAGQRLAYDLAGDLYQKLQRRSLAHHNERTVGDALNRLFGDSWSLYTISYALLTIPLQHLATVVVVGWIAWHVDRGLTMIALGIVPIATTLAYVMAARLQRISRDEARLTSEIMAFVQQTLSAIPLIQAFAATRQTQKVYDGFARRGVALASRGALVNQTVLTLSSFTVAGATSAVLLVGGLRVLSGDLSLGTLIVFVAYVKTINVSVEACLNAMAKTVAANAGLRRVVEILDEAPGVDESPQAVAYYRPKAQRAGNLIFESVGFRYPEQASVLEAIDLAIQPGETIALVGPSGGGKSTLVSLIPRFFDPTSGRVLIDGQDLKELTLSSLRSQISMVLQEPFLMPMTVAENIAYDPSGYTRDEIIAASVVSGAHRFIRALPQGFDTIIGERGMMLSGGQKQLIAISRAILKNAPILILDEPTSALDVETETQLMAGLKTLMRDRTTIIVAHRLSTIRAADRILLVQNGTVQELSSFADTEACLGGTLAG